MIMSKNMNKRDWLHQSQTLEESDNVPLHVINEQRAEKHLTNLQSMLKEISAFQRHHKVDEDITLNTD